MVVMGGGVAVVMGWGRRTAIALFDMEISK